jgi:hypothetical protein
MTVKLLNESLQLREELLDKIKVRGAGWRNNSSTPASRHLSDPLGTVEGCIIHDNYEFLVRVVEKWWKSYSIKSPKYVGIC